MASVRGQEFLEAGEEDEQEDVGDVRAVKLLHVKLQQWARVGPQCPSPQKARPQSEPHRKLWTLGDDVSRQAP